MFIYKSFKRMKIRGCTNFQRQSVENVCPSEIKTRSGKFWLVSLLYSFYALLWRVSNKNESL